MIIKIQVARKEEKTTSAKKMKVILNCELKMNISANTVFLLEGVGIGSQLSKISK